MSGADDSALFLTKINSSFKEEYTKEVLGKESYYVGANTIIKSGDKLIMITIILVGISLVVIGWIFDH